MQLNHDARIDTGQVQDRRDGGGGLDKMIPIGGGGRLGRNYDLTQECAAGKSCGTFGTCAGLTVMDPPV